MLFVGRGFGSACTLFPLIQIICAFQLYQHSGSIQTGACQLLGSILVVVSLLMLQTDENILRIRRTVLLTNGMLRIGYNWGAFAEDMPPIDISWGASPLQRIAQWHLYSTVMYTSLVDHLQDSFFIGAVALATSPTCLSTVIGLTMTSTVALCGKLMWCRLQLEN